MIERRFVVAVAASLLLAAPGVVSADSEWVVTGHTVFTNMSGFDPCLAAVAGVVRAQVLWFNDQVLLEHAVAGNNGRFIYAVQENAPDPRRPDVALIPSGTVYNFTDPNNERWTVNEYRYRVADPQLNPTTGNVKHNATLDFHAWVVGIGNTTFDMSLGTAYNFVDIVDICKFVEPGCNCAGPTTGNVTHNGTAEGPNDGNPQNGGVWDGNSHNASKPGEQHTFPHTHDTGKIDLYIGREPVVSSEDALLL